MTTMKTEELGTLNLNVAMFTSKKKMIDKLYEDLASFQESYIENKLFSTSSGSSVDAFEDLLTTVRTTTKTMSSILQQTSEYMDLIKDSFVESDKEQASKLQLV